MQVWDNYYCSNEAIELWKIPRGTLTWWPIELMVRWIRWVSSTWNIGMDCSPIVIDCRLFRLSPIVSAADDVSVKLYLSLTHLLQLHWRRLVKNIVGKGDNNWWKHKRFSIIGVRAWVPPQSLCLCATGKCICAVLLKCSQQQQQILTLETELKGFKNNIQDEQRKNEKATHVLGKTEEEMNRARNSLNACLAKHEELKNEYSLYNRILKETEDALTVAILVSLVGQQYNL